MKKLTLIAASAAAAAMVAIPSAGAEDQKAQQSTELTKGEIRLAKMLEGRVAGEPQSCISTFSTNNLTVIDGTALVYKSGRTLYVNVPQRPESLDNSDTLVRRTSFANRLCNTDIIRTVDFPSGMQTGSVFLGQFVPYRKQG